MGRHLAVMTPEPRLAEPPASQVPDMPVAVADRSEDGRALGAGEFVVREKLKLHGPG